MTKTSSKSAPPSSSNKEHTFDAIVVGASIAGSIAALELANKGWRVAVLEKRQNLEHYKKLCTHIIHPGGVRALERHHLLNDLKSKSAHDTGMRVEYAGQDVYFPLGGKLTAANIERQDIDPALKQALDKHSMITLLLGYTLTEILTSNNSVNGLIAKTSDGELHPFNSYFLIAADGRDSTCVKLAEGSHAIQSNHRVALFSYVEAVSPTQKYSRIWALERGEQYVGVFPNQRRTLISWYVSESYYKDIQSQKERSFDGLNTFLKTKGVTVGPRLDAVVVAKQTSPQRASVSLKGLALIGDAKLTADPLTGVGCSWAMSSASLLATCVGKAPLGELASLSSHKRLRFRISVYNALHAVLYRMPSFLMTLASMHGKWIFNKPVYKSMSWFSKIR